MFQQDFSIFLLKPLLTNKKQHNFMYNLNSSWFLLLKRTNA